MCARGAAGGRQAGSLTYFWACRRGGAGVPWVRACGASNRRRAEREVVTRDSDDEETVANACRFMGCSLHAGAGAKRNGAERNAQACRLLRVSAARALQAGHADRQPSAQGPGRRQDRRHHRQQQRPVADRPAAFAPRRRPTTSRRGRSARTPTSSNTTGGCGSSSIPVNKEVVSVDTGDFNGDGKPDLVFYGTPAEVEILFNEGKAGFGESQEDQHRRRWWRSRAHWPWVTSTRTAATTWPCWPRRS